MAILRRGAMWGMRTQGRVNVAARLAAPAPGRFPSSTHTAQRPQPDRSEHGMNGVGAEAGVRLGNVGSEVRGCSVGTSLTSRHFRHFHGHPHVVGCMPYNRSLSRLQVLAVIPSMASRISSFTDRCPRPPTSWAKP